MKRTLYRLALVLAFISASISLTACDWKFGSVFGDVEEVPTLFGEIDNQDEVFVEDNVDTSFCSSGSEWCVGNIIYPVPPMRCSTRYSNEHQALDVASNSSARETLGEPIMASWPGTVVKSWMDPVTGKDSSKGLGNLMVVEYRYKDIPADQRPSWLGKGESIYVRYSHLDSRSFGEGAIVEPGDEIGKVGETGKATGPHIHMQVKSDEWGSYSGYDNLETMHNPLEVFPSICTN